MENKEAIERYRLALIKYKRACSEYLGICTAYKALKEPTVVQRFLYLDAKEKHSKICKEFNAEKTAWHASFIQSHANEISSREALQQLIGQMPSDKFKEVERDATRDERIAAIRNNPAFNKFLIVAEAYTRGEVIVPEDESSNQPVTFKQDGNTPVEEKVLETMDNPDVFDDLPGENNEPNSE